MYCIILQSQHYIVTVHVVEAMLVFASVYVYTAHVTLYSLSSFCVVVG